ncbi:MAG TPA: hypothetical protein VJ869_01585, partial [Sphaerochaeta sp.]|nr:hypothetical protein [Sphaerochaeta sp.]
VLYSKYHPLAKKSCLSIYIVANDANTMTNDRQVKLEYIGPTPSVALLPCFIGGQCMVLVT